MSNPFPQEEAEDQLQTQHISHSSSVKDVLQQEENIFQTEDDLLQQEEDQLCQMESGEYQEKPYVSTETKTKTKTKDKTEKYQSKAQKDIIKSRSMLKKARINAREIYTFQKKKKKKKSSRYEVQNIAQSIKGRFFVINITQESLHINAMLFNFDLKNDDLRASLLKINHRKFFNKITSFAIELGLFVSYQDRRKDGTFKANTYMIPYKIGSEILKQSSYGKEALEYDNQENIMHCILNFIIKLYAQYINLYNHLTRSVRKSAQYQYNRLLEYDGEEETQLLKKENAVENHRLYVSYAQHNFLYYGAKNFENFRFNLSKKEVMKFIISSIATKTTNFKMNSLQVSLLKDTALEMRGNVLITGSLIQQIFTGFKARSQHLKHSKEKYIKNKQIYFLAKFVHKGAEIKTKKFMKIFASALENIHYKTIGFLKELRDSKIKAKEFLVQHSFYTEKILSI